ncbi:mechanosensitive ion channel family protein [Haloglomus halophilum]|uniref:mechanosensitive ion channel family protein n=1 Tax=Haloglomus halophilum TaxID=2962672 RepID=UPI0020C9A8DA|nr:mechanosensitive ion channel family protein [Haloglomus halophilum]
MTLPLVPAQTGGATDPTGFVQSFIESLGVGASLAAPIAAAVVFIVVFVAIYLLGRVLVTPLFGRFLDRRDLDEHAKRPLKKVVGGVIVFIAIGIAFGLAGFGSILQSLATVAAAATLAIGFAMQDVIANFVAGVFIYTDKPFRIGDWIEWDDRSGIVEDISLRVTRVRTFDNELLTVPNSTLTDGVIKNPVAKDKLRMKFVFGIGYEDDIEQATDIILEEAEKHDDILDDPAPSVRLTELADSYVGLQSRFWIANPSRADFVRTRGEYVTDVKQRFDENDINIPYPQVDLSGGIEMAGPVAEAMARGEAESD